MHRQIKLSVFPFILLGATAVAQTDVTTTTGGTAGAVPYFTTSANVEKSIITQSSGKVGIGTGTAALGSLFQVSGGIAIGNSYITVAAPSGGAIVQGRVGIGTTSPYAALDVEGTGSIVYLGEANDANTDTLVRLNSGRALFGYSASGYAIVQGGSGKGVALATNGSATPSFYIDNSSRVGIGTTTPLSLLSVGASSQFQVGTSGAITAPSMTASGTVAAATFTGSGSGLTGIPYSAISGAPAAGVTSSGGTANAIPKYNADGATITSSAISDSNGIHVISSGIGVGAFLFTPQAGLDIEQFMQDTFGIGISLTNTSGVPETASLTRILFKGGGPITGQIPVDFSMIQAGGEDYNSNYGFLGFQTSDGNSLYERMRITHTGNVGIGTAAPVSLLSVGSSSQFQVSTSGAVTAPSFAASGTVAAAIFTGSGSGLTGIPYSAITGAPAAGVTSVFGRSGVVTAASGDYSVSQITGAAPLADPQFSGSVGIGTTTPGSMLQVGNTYTQNPSIMIGGRDDSTSDTGSYSLLFGAYRDIELISSGIVATPVWTCCSGFPASGGYPGIRSNSLGFYTNYNPTNPTEYSPNLFISTSGNVGVGTTNPQSALEVNGNIAFTSTTSSGPGAGGSLVFPDHTVQSTAYTGTCSTGADYAESVDVNGEKGLYEPGDVMVIDPSRPRYFVKSFEPYSTLVAGIYSTQPGFVGKRQTYESSVSKSEIPMAMVGIVPTKVSTENGSIKVGDLLVTSSMNGYAMKGTNHSRMTGAIVGKALGNIESGTGIIEVLVSLQ